MEASYRAWGVDLMTLLDRIEVVTEEEEVRALARGRFAIAEKHGFDIVMGPEIPRVDQ